MKKIFFMAVSAVLLAAGCQKTEIQNEAIPQIGFKTQMGKLTKADPDAKNSGEAKLQEQGFMVWGHIVTEDLNHTVGKLYLADDKNPGGGIELTYDPTNKKWGTSDIHYWPGKGKELDIYAVSMSQTNENTYRKVERQYTTETVNDVKKIDANPTTLKVNDFVVEASADNDLMVAPMIRQDQGDAETVNLNFQHALTKVLVTFRALQDEDDAVYVVSAKTSSLTSNGTLTVTNTAPVTTVDGESGATNTTPATPAPNGPINYSAAIALNNWTAATTPATAEYSAIYNGTSETVTNVVAGPKGDDNNPITTFTAYKLSSTPITFGTWLLIPQEITKDTYLDVEYIVAGTYVKQRFNLWVENVLTKWDVNQQTSYNIKISPDDIQFEPDVKDWSTGTVITEERDN